MKVRDIMRVKGHALFTVSPQDPLHQALASMAQNDIGSVVVMQQGALVGILTFREIIATVHSKPDAYRGLTVDGVMDTTPAVLAPDAELQEVLQACWSRTRVICLLWMAQCSWGCLAFMMWPRPWWKVSVLKMNSSSPIFKTGPIAHLSPRGA